jgi:hypothetical protein
MLDALTEAGKSRKGQIAESMPKGALSLSHVELNAIETEGQHFFS